MAESLTAEELRWYAHREIPGDGRALARAFEVRIKALEEQLAILQEQFQVAADRAQSWQNLCEHWKELAEARGEALALRDRRGEALALRDRRGPCGYRNHAADCTCNGEGGDR